MRSKRTARYIERSVFYHNEDIPSHYVDNFVKAKDTPSNIVAKFAQTLSVIGEQMKKFPLTEFETRRLNMALRIHMLNFIEPQRSVLRRERFLKFLNLKEIPLPNDTNQGWSELIEGFKELERNPQKLDELRLKWCTIQDISNPQETEKWDPLFREMRILYNKYESPKRIARRKEINEKLSRNHKDGSVGKTPNFSGTIGVEPPTN